jgi:hypothetical protein
VDGRHLGFLSLLTDAADHPAGPSRDLIAGAVLTASVDALSLPGLPSHPLLVGGGRRCCIRGGAGSDELVRVTVLGCAREPMDHLLAAVTLSPPGNLRGLSRLQLQLVGLPGALSDPPE